MARTASANLPSHSSEWSPVSIATNTETPRPILSGSTTATRFWITPSASSFWIRFQQGVDDRPTRLPTSATEREASCCSTPRILRSIASIPRSSWRKERSCEAAVSGNYFCFEAQSVHTEKNILFQAGSTRQIASVLRQKRLDLGAARRAENAGPFGICAFERGGGGREAHSRANVCAFGEHQREGAVERVARAERVDDVYAECRELPQFAV